MERNEVTSPGLLAIRVTIASVMLGAIYFAYITLDEFPPDIVRIVPVIWLVGALIGFMLGIRSMLANEQRLHGLLSILINVVNLPLSAVFTFAASMGD